MEDDLSMNWPEPISAKNQAKRMKRKARELEERKAMESRRKLRISVADPMVKQILRDAEDE